MFARKHALSRSELGTKKIEIEASGTGMYACIFVLGSFEAQRFWSHQCTSIHVNRLL